ncbi:hypothetical protein [Winogradskyella sp.]|uniref:hypothetical protein n=1 Tax=Winogradskyella sp. TaxID=1883156 RepID=UPI002632B1CB|nr:hypothetical protein [Winogradskyella sp.]
MKQLFTILSLVVSLIVSSQTQVDYKGIDSLGRSFTAKLKRGDLEEFKNLKPPKDTWTYARLLDYKEDLDNPDINIIIGDFVEQSTSETTYGYNLFAYTRSDENSYEYYFVAIVSIDTSEGEPRIENVFLFTEKEGLKSWWGHVFGLYYNETYKDTPKSYRYPVCPPPPFKTDD